jgi:hypothetical protein
VTVPYVEIETYKELAGIKVDIDDARTQLALEAATEAISKVCDRTFYAVNETAADEIRYYTARRPLTLEIDDLIELHEFATDLSGTGVFQSIWEQDRDFYLEPLNALAKGRPFERIKVRPNARFLLSSFPRTARLTGVFGWPEMPSAVTQATVIVATRLRMRKETPFGIASFGTEVAMRLLKTDPDLQLLLDDLTRDSVLY